MHPCAIISIFFLAVGLVINFIVFLSLPFVPNFNTYFTEIQYATPLTGTLNGVLPYENLTSIRVSLAAFLLNYDQLGLFFRPVG
jgi:hypothetical protein